MSKTKFTPGPWEVSYGNAGSIFGDKGNPDHDGDYPYVGEVAGITWDEKANDPESNANARLIAAAPEMYEMLSILQHTTCLPEQTRREIQSLLNSINHEQ